VLTRSTLCCRVKLCIISYIGWNHAWVVIIGGGKYLLAVDPQNYAIAIDDC